MNRDDMPTGAAIALATGELMVTARRLTARLPRLADQPPEGLAAAVAAVRAGLLELWAAVPPEAVRDVMVTAATMAREAGVTEVPEALADMPPGELLAAMGMLELAAEAGDAEGRLLRAFASSVAFDRDDDSETLASLSVLLTLAHLVIPSARASAG